MRAATCVGTVNRNLRYGLNYYSVTPLPDCSAGPMPNHIEQNGREAPIVVKAGPGQAVANTLHASY
jgi:hypothetical protein